MPEPQRTFLARMDRETERKGGCFIDGDTFVCECLLSQEPRLKQGEVRIRLLEVDTPEVKGKTKEPGLAAAAFTRLWLESVERTGGRWYFLIQFVKKDSFGRWLAYLWDCTTGECLNEALVREGHAKPMPLTKHLKE